MLVPWRVRIVDYLGSSSYFGLNLALEIPVDLSETDLLKLIFYSPTMG